MSPTISITIAGPKDQAEAFKKRLKEEAARQGISLSELIVETMAQYLRDKDAGE